MQTLYKVTIGYNSTPLCCWMCLWKTGTKDKRKF